MSKLFFDHLILVDEVASQLDQFNLEPEDRAELLSLIDQTLHHHTLNVIFNLLPPEKHADFVGMYKTGPADVKLLAYLKKEIKEDIEAEIKKQADRVKKEILLEVSKAKKR